MMLETEAKTHFVVFRGNLIVKTLFSCSLSLIMLSAILDPKKKKKKKKLFKNKRITTEKALLFTQEVCNHS